MIGGSRLSEPARIPWDQLLVLLDAAPGPEISDAAARNPETALLALITALNDPPKDMDVKAIAALRRALIQYELGRAAGEHARRMNETGTSDSAAAEDD